MGPLILKQDALDHFGFKAGAVVGYGERAAAELYRDAWRRSGLLAGVQAIVDQFLRHHAGPPVFLAVAGLRREFGFREVLQLTRNRENLSLEFRFVRVHVVASLCIGRDSFSRPVIRHLFCFIVFPVEGVVDCGGLSNTFLTRNESKNM